MEVTRDSEDKLIVHEGNMKETKFEESDMKYSSGHLTKKHVCLNGFLSRTGIRHRLTDKKSRDWHIIETPTVTYPW